MSHDAWFCRDCTLVRDLDCHGRCVVCGSDSVVPASVVQSPPGTVIPRLRIPANQDKSSWHGA
jgi:hypothetical protein